MSDVLLPFPPEGVACPSCATVFRGGRSDGRVVGDRWLPFIDCTGCLRSMRLWIGSVGPDGVDPWRLVEFSLS